MKIDYGLIPCAGFGTRMGKIGKILPKPIWPLFSSSLLELQIKKLSKVVTKKIFINTHHMHDEVKRFVRDNNLDVEILHEEIILGSGGCVHNVGRNVDYKGSLIISNPDCLRVSDLRNLSGFMEQGNALVPMTVSPDEKYNRFELDKKGNLEAVKLFRESLSNLTYAGVGMIQLESLPRVQGQSHFFEQVVFNSSLRFAITPALKNEEVLDFGEIDLFYKNCFGLNNLDSSSEFMQSLLSDVPDFSRGDPGAKFLNFSSRQIDAKEGIIVLEADSETFIDRPGIYYKNQFDPAT